MSRREEASMPPERWRVVKAIVAGALDCAPTDRAAFLERMCAGDAELRREVDSLLAAATGTGMELLEMPIAAARVLGAFPGDETDDTGAGEEMLAQLRAALASRYRIERELGRGGMATVHLAHDQKHRRRVALKVLDPHLAAAIGAERFRREIETAAGLSHPHILPLFDSGEARGMLYYVMPYVTGGSLRDRLRREGTLSVDAALHVVREVADALDHAHRHDVVHRDVKPENVLLDEDGHALVSDFGIARAVHRAATEGSARQGSTLTQTGMAIGTPAYMSPEQALGDRELDGSSDVYSLACVAFELLAGETPYHGSSAQQLARRFKQPLPRLTLRRPDLPSAADAAIARALSLSPRERFPTATAFAVDLARALAGASGDSPIAPDVPRGRSGGDVMRASAREAPAVGIAAMLRAPRHPYGRRSAALLASLALLGAVGMLTRGPLAKLRPMASDVAAAGAAGEGPAVEPDAGAGAHLPRVAVLPFENLGDSADAYFVDGVVDEVRGKLAALPKLRVIARASSNEYRRTRKRPEEIARELGVEYLLTGTIRSVRRGGRARVRVTPELVRVTRARAPVTVWQRGIDAEVVDLFQVQSAVAQQVAEGLDVTLGSSERTQLATRPTTSLAAYDAFLHGEQVYGMTNQDAPSLLRAVRLYERAVALDSTFVQAWARLAHAQAALARTAPSNIGSRDASRRAAVRALALAPESPAARLAMGQYYMDAMSEAAKAAEQFTIGLRAAPNDVELLAALAWAEEGLGRWDSAIEHFRRAAALDPRALNPARFLGLGLLMLRRYPEARVSLDRAIALAPQDLTTRGIRMLVELADGDLGRARAVLDAGSLKTDSAVFVAFIATHLDLGWVLDDAQQRLLLSLGPEPFGGDRAMWGLVLAQMHDLQGNTSASRIYADSARLAMEAALRRTPDDANLRANYAVSLAYLGQRAAAVREGRRGVALLPVTKDAYNGPYQQLQLARVHILLGEREAALDQLEPLLALPFYLSPGWLAIDPTFEPLRGHPRFERLVRRSP